jgi:hypothetical protein
MRRFESGKEIFKKKRKKGAQFQKKKKSAIITARKNILSENINRLKLIMRKPIILKKNENKRFRKSLSRENLEKS